jgi:LPXTG-site transpeptidase (sortase) family protein
MSNGDEIFITYRGKFYKYKVFETKEVNPEEVGNYVESKDEQLTLMTCAPVGTNLRRLLIFAKPG